MFVMADLNGYKEIKENKVLKKHVKRWRNKWKKKKDEQAVSKILILNDGKSLTQNNVCPDIFHAWKFKLSTYACVFSYTIV